MIDLARHHNGGGRRKAREISQSVDIPRQYVAQVLGPLVRAGLVDGLVGPDGGYRLSRDPAEVTLLEVVEAAEGWTGRQECLLRGGPCNEADPCELHTFWVAARDRLIAQLNEVTFADLAKRQPRRADVVERRRGRPATAGPLSRGGRSPRP